MNYFSIPIVLAVCVSLIAWCTTTPVVYDEATAPVPNDQVVSLVTMGSWVELVDITTPGIDSGVSSPLTVVWTMPWYWFFEATAPIRVEDNDWVLLGESYVIATAPRMTESVIWFSGSTATWGVLILKRNNASGMIENEGYVEIPVVF
jgi:hypothetical protein